MSKVYPWHQVARDIAAANDYSDDNINQATGDDVYGRDRAQVMTRADIGECVWQGLHNDELPAYYPDGVKMSVDEVRAKGPTLPDVCVEPESVNSWLRKKGHLDTWKPAMDSESNRVQDKGKMTIMGTVAQDWRQKVRDAATQWCKERKLEGKSRPTKTAVATEVAVWCRNNGIVTDTGASPSAGYIRRHILNRWNHP